LINTILSLWHLVLKFVLFQPQVFDVLIAWAVHAVPLGYRAGAVSGRICPYRATGAIDNELTPRRVIA